MTEDDNGASAQKEQKSGSKKIAKTKEEVGENDEENDVKNRGRCKQTRSKTGLRRSQLSPTKMITIRRREKTRKYELKTEKVQRETVMNNKKRGECEEMLENVNEIGVTKPNNGRVLSRRSKLEQTREESQ
eukprot:6198580-Pleurochrysis_carterae.AAC.4